MPQEDKKEIIEIKKENIQADEIIQEENTENKKEITESIENENTPSLEENSDLLEPSDLGIEVKNESVSVLILF